MQVGRNSSEGATVPEGAVEYRTMDTQGQFIAEILSHSPRAIASGVIGRQIELQPRLLEAFGGRGFKELTADTEVRLLYLAEALAAGRPQLFVDQIEWNRSTFLARQVPIEILSANLQCMRDELGESLPEAQVGVARDVVQEAIDRLSQTSEVESKTAETFLQDGTPRVELARRLLVALLEGRRDDAARMMLEAMSSGASYHALTEEVIETVLGEIGRMWQTGEVSVADEHLASHIIEHVLEEMKRNVPRAAPTGKKILATSVSGNLHDIGIRLVADRFELAGWETFVLGANTPHADVVLALEHHRPDVLAISATLALHVRATAELIERVRSSLGEKTPHILVGGRPFGAVHDLWQIVGADGCGLEILQS